MLNVSNVGAEKVPLPIRVYPSCLSISHREVRRWNTGELLLIPTIVDDIAILDEHYGTLGGELRAIIWDDIRISISTPNQNRANMLIIQYK